ncbi:MAG: M3 family oligoendopeptidase [Roseiflexaceae bacterium]
MQPSLPQSADAFTSWAQAEPFVQELRGRTITPATLDAWLVDWTRLARLVLETYQRLYVATTVDTADQAAERRYYAFLEEIFPASQAAEQQLKQQLLASGLEPQNFALALEQMRVQAQLFRDANLPLLTDEQKLSNADDKVRGAQTVIWEGQELTLDQLQPLYQDADRAVRERAWRLAQARLLEDRGALNDVWGRMLQLRRQIAANAGCADYREYRWRQLLRFDYSPADCEAFHQAIEQVVVPAAERIYERRRRQLGLATLRPWDLDVDAQGRAPLRPFGDVAELQATCAAMLARVNPELGAQFAIMQREQLLDLDNRKGKAHGGYCNTFPLAERPFIFMNAVGVHEDVNTLLHEAGHAFHVFHTFDGDGLPYYQQWEVGMEFAEVASMSMELLAAPYLPASTGGFYTDHDAARARVEQLEGILRFWPYMAVVDAFQHWAYTHPDAAAEPASCEATWSSLWQRFMRGVDWSGLEDELADGWRQKVHIFQLPFYYVEYGLAQLGAVQVWRNSLSDHADAVARYRYALSLGGTANLPGLFAAAGARFAFDAATLREVLELIERTIVELEGQLA